MALTVDYSVAPFLITIPKSDLTLESGTKYKLTVDEFWLLLRDFTDNESTMAQPKLYSRIPATTSTPSITEVDGTYYALEFEDGLYSVNIIEGNTNIRDVEVKNQVSVNTNNTTGFIDPVFLQHGTYDGGVWLDGLSGLSGTAYPIGTPSAPVGNAPDAVTIATSQGFDTLEVVGGYTFTTGDNVSGFTIRGRNATKSALVFDAAAVAAQCEIFDCSLSGTLDGGSTVRDCEIGTLDYLNGVVNNCVLGAGTITLGGGADAIFLQCYSGVAGYDTPTIDLGGSGQSLVLRGYTGGIELTNKTGADPVSIDLDGGQVKLAATVTNGLILIRGVGTLVDNSVGATVDATGLVTGDANIATAVWADSKALTVPKFLGLK